MINIKKVLVPTDFSDMSVPAIGYAISLANKYAAEVTVLHSFPAAVMREHFSQGYAPEGVLSPGAATIGVTRPLDMDSIIETKTRLLHDFLERKIGPDLVKAVKIKPLVRFGKAVQEIVAAAKEEQSDVIVMTSHGSGLRRLFRGSFTERVARRAPCPVISIQPSAEVRTEEDKRVPVKLMEKWAA